MSKRGRHADPNNYIVDANGCWIWQGRKTANGYGTFELQYKDHRAHKYHFEKKYGPVPVGKQLDHKCKVKACCNPDHVEPVTQIENMRRAGQIRLTIEQVGKIKTRLKNGEHHMHIVREYGVSES